MHETHGLIFEDIHGFPEKNVAKSDKQAWNGNWFCLKDQIKIHGSMSFR